MSLLLLFSTPPAANSIVFNQTSSFTANGSVASITFLETSSFAATGTSSTASLDARGSIEALEAGFGSDSRNARESIEALYNIMVTGINARESYEALYQLIQSGRDARLSIEILEDVGGAAKTRWGSVIM